MAHQHERPVLIFDGYCGVCTASVDWIRVRLVREIEMVPWQAIDIAKFGLSQQDVDRAAWWIQHGEKASGHLAIAKALQVCCQPWRMMGWVLALPPVSWMAAVGYYLVARNRGLFRSVTPACKRDPWQHRCRKQGDISHA